MIKKLIILISKRGKIYTSMRVCNNLNMKGLYFVQERKDLDLVNVIDSSELGKLPGNCFVFLNGVYLDDLEIIRLNIEKYIKMNKRNLLIKNIIN